MRVVESKAGRDSEYGVAAFGPFRVFGGRLQPRSRVDVLPVCQGAGISEVFGARAARQRVDVALTHRRCRCDTVWVRGDAVVSSEVRNSNRLECREFVDGFSRVG